MQNSDKSHVQLNTVQISMVQSLPIHRLRLCSQHKLQHSLCAALKQVSYPPEPAYAVRDSIALCCRNGLIHSNFAVLVCLGWTD